MNNTVVRCIVLLFAVVGSSLAASHAKAEHEKKAICRFTVGEVKGKGLLFIELWRYKSKLKSCNEMNLKN